MKIHSSDSRTTINRPNDLTETSPICGGRKTRNILWDDKWGKQEDVPHVDELVNVRYAHEKYRVLTNPFLDAKGNVCIVVSPDEGSLRGCSYVVRLSRVKRLPPKETFLVNVYIKASTVDATSEEEALGLAKENAVKISVSKAVP